MDTAIYLTLFLLIFARVFSLCTHISEKTTDHKNDISILNGIKDALSINQKL